jgi:hypothetical protein
MEDVNPLPHGPRRFVSLRQIIRRQLSMHEYTGVLETIQSAVGRRCSPLCCAPCSIMTQNCPYLPYHPAG